MNNFSRDSFTSSFGVLVALVGSAVGLGNIWRFPYMMGEHGGAAFIIIYIACAFLLSMPIMVSEFVIGRRSQMNMIGAFKTLAPGTKWFLTGSVCIVTVFIILSFYSVIGGWCINYFIKSISLSFAGTPDLDFDKLFDQSIATGFKPLLFTVLFYGLTALIVSRGIKGGIEQCSKIMIPMLLIMIIGLAVFSLSLPGAGEGIRYIFKPDFSQINGKTVVAAMGQAFFSLSVGVGTIITYASYVTKKENILACSTKTVITDALFAVISGCAIMPAVFAFGYNPGEGPGLVFITLPNLFAHMKAGAVVSIIFFFALLIAALSSSISMLEVIVSYVSEKYNKSRQKAILMISGFAIVLAVLNSLSQGPLNGFRIHGKELLSFCDYLTASFLMTLGALLIVLFVGWKMGKKTFVEEITNGGSINIPAWLSNTIFFLIRYIAPLVIISIVVFSFVE